MLLHATSITSSHVDTRSARSSALKALAKQVHGYMNGAKDSARVHTVANEIERLAAK